VSAAKKLSSLHPLGEVLVCKIRKEEKKKPPRLCIYSSAESIKYLNVYPPEHDLFLVSAPLIGTGSLSRSSRAHSSAGFANFSFTWHRWVNSVPDLMDRIRPSRFRVLPARTEAEHIMSE